jgi:hypothetical protein
VQGREGSGGAAAELRISLLRLDAHLAVVLGAAVTIEWIDGFDAWTGTTATLAWREPRWSVPPPKVPPTFPMRPPFRPPRRPRRHPRFRAGAATP